MKKLCVLAICLLGAGSSIAEEVLTIEGTRIRGNQELPTILYLIPWKEPELRQLEAPEQSLAVKQTLEPLEREDFRRLVEYHQHFKALQSRADSP